MKKFAIIVAGGKGLRMGGDLAKQFIVVGGKPVLMRTLEAFRRADEEICLIVVLPHEQQAYWKELCSTYRFGLPHQIACGGATRFESVHNGLKQINADGLVAVHDGVRPFVSARLINRAFDAAAVSGAVVPVTEAVESIRRIGPDGVSRAEDRAAYRFVQTPQVFSAALLHEAYRQPYREAFTDDASVVEALGRPIHLIPGERENIKITTPFDLRLAETLLY